MAIETYLLTQFMIYRALNQFLFIDDFLNNLIIDFFAVSLEALLAHLFLLCLELINVTKLIKLFVHIDRDVAEDVEHHGDDNVENNPLHYNIEEHEVNAWPILATCTTHHIRHSRPVIDNHKRVKGHNTRA